MRRVKLQWGKRLLASQGKMACLLEEFGGKGWATAGRRTTGKDLKAPAKDRVEKKKTLSLPLNIETGVRRQKTKELEKSSGKRGKSFF